MTYFFTYGFLLLSRWAQFARSFTILYWPIFFGLFLLSALRYEVGCDWINYLGNFEDQQWASLGDAFEQRNAGHWVLLEVLDILDLQYYWLNVATSAIFFAGLHTIAKRSPEPLTILVLAFPILILNMPMSAVKQAAAIGFICFAFNAFCDRRIGLFILFIALGATFHSSALIFLILTPFVFGEYNRRNMSIAAIMAIPLIAVLLSSEAAEVATSRYIDTDIGAQGAVFRIAVLMATGLMFFMFLSRRWAAILPESHKLMALLAGGMIALGPLIAVSSVIADRFGYYLFVPAVMIYAALPTLFPRGQMNLLKVAPYVALTLVFVGWTQLSSHYAFCYDPYSTVQGRF